MINLCACWSIIIYICVLYLNCYFIDTYLRIYYYTLVSYGRYIWIGSFDAFLCHDCISNKVYTSKKTKPKNYNSKNIFIDIE